MAMNDFSFQRGLDALAAVPTDDFAGANPFPHIVLDDFIETGFAAELHGLIMGEGHDWEETADPDTMTIWRSQWQSEYCIPTSARELVRFLNSGLLLREMSRLSGIPRLIADPYYTGGGFHRVGHGGQLGIHVDGNWHGDMGLHRRLNAILYLNPDWRGDYGGRLGFYADPLASPAVEIAPLPGRLVIFETHDFSYHGYPERIVCPPDVARTSIILYYYTAEARPAHQVRESRPHSAYWQRKGWRDVRGGVVREPAFEQDDVALISSPRT